MSDAGYLVFKPPISSAKFGVCFNQESIPFNQCCMQDAIDRARSSLERFSIVPTAPACSVFNSPIMRSCRYQDSRGCVLSSCDMTPRKSCFALLAFSSSTAWYLVLSNNCELNIARRPDSTLRKEVVWLNESRRG